MIDNPLVRTDRSLCTGCCQSAVYRDITVVARTLPDPTCCLKGTVARTPEIHQMLFTLITK